MYRATYFYHLPYYLPQNGHIFNIHMLLLVRYTVVYLEIMAPLKYTKSTLSSTSLGKFYFRNMKAPLSSFEFNKKTGKKTKLSEYNINE